MDGTNKFAQTAIAQVQAAYEKQVRANSRIRALEKKLSDGTISMREAAELNSLRAELFGKAFSGKVLDIDHGEREGTCTALLRKGCSDADELAQAAQRAALTRQGLNITPPTAPFEEARARKIGHSLEDETVPDETIERRARSATENMLRSQYDRNMEQGAKTCAEAGLKTYIVRDSGSGCCKWCDEVSGKFVYGTEPKDVYRRHDNCTCTVVYESGRGRQNVWSKQYWSAEQEREYLRLRDEMKAKKMTEAPNVKKPVRLSEKEIQAIKEQVGGLTYGGNGGIISERGMANGMRKSPLIKLTEKDKTHLLSEIKAIDADPSKFSFRDYIGSAYSDERDMILVSSNIFPSNDGSKHPRDLMSERAALAHEYYGHRAFRGTTLEKGSWNDEFRASYFAAKNCPNLSDEDRYYLVLDAIERAKEAGVTIKNNKFIRSVLYG